MKDTVEAMNGLEPQVLESCRKFLVLVERRGFKTIEGYNDQYDLSWFLESIRELSS